MGQGNKRNYTRARGYSLEELWNNQIGPNFWERFKNKELGSQKMDQIIDSIKEDWNALDGPDSNIHERRFKRGLEILASSFAETWQDKRSIDSWQEALNPIEIFTALGLRTIEAGGYVLDATVGNAARKVSSTLGLDPRWGEVASTGAQLFVGPAALRVLPKGYNTLSRLAGSQKSLNFASKINKSLRTYLSQLDEATAGLRNVSASNRTITLKNYGTVVDDVLTKTGDDFRSIVKVAKQNHISFNKAEDWINLKRQGIRPNQRINPGTNAGLLGEGDLPLNKIHARLIQQGKNRGTIYDIDGNPVDPKLHIDESKYQPPENFSGITPPTFEQARQKINRAIGSDVYIRHDDGVPRFDFVKLQNNKVFTSEYKRLIGSDISTIDEFGLPFAKRKRNVQYESRKSSYVGYRKELIDQYLEWYGPAMKRLGISPSQIDLDHRLTLIQSLGIYHNVDPKSQLWIDIQNTAVRRGIYPGDAKRNLDLADPESHRLKSNYFNDLHGLSLKGSKKNMKYWGGLHRDTGKTRLQIMEESHLGPEYEKAHLEVVNDYFDLVERGNRILDSARAMWHAENMKGILPEEIVKTLMKVSLDPKYNTKQLQQIVRSMMDVEIEKYRKIQRLFEIEEELDLINASPETILDTDPQDIKDLKIEWKKLKTVRNSKWFKKHYNEMMKLRDAEIASPQRNIYELLDNTSISEERFLEILKEYGISDD